MDDFDRRLEIELAQMLDPIVDAPVPVRRRQSQLRALDGGGLDGQPIDVNMRVVSEPVHIAARVGTSV
jgi:hypothetical protein